MTYGFGEPVFTIVYMCLPYFLEVNVKAHGT